jgi:hypothetical protein
MYHASITQASVTHLASVAPKIEAGDQSSYGLLARPLTLDRQGSWDGHLAQLPHLWRWITGDLVKKRSRSPST